jgi:hypothetical protein
VPKSSWCWKFRLLSQKAFLISRHSSAELSAFWDQGWSNQVQERRVGRTSGKCGPTWAILPRAPRLEFADLYDGKSVAIDEGRVKNYGKARAIMALADERRIDRAIFVAKLHSLRDLIDAGRTLAEMKTGSAVHQHGFIAWVNGARNPALR